MSSVLMLFRSSASLSLFSMEAISALDRSWWTSVTIKYYPTASLYKISLDQLIVLCPAVFSGDHDGTMFFLVNVRSAYVLQSY